MKSIREIFKNKDYLLDEPEVEKEKNKELVMLDMIREVIKGCNAIQNEQTEHERFGYEAPNYQETINNLKSYILERCRDERIWL
jgi:hypothetical protein